MIFTWLKRRRRRKLLAEPFPPDWLPYLQENVRHYALLTSDEQARLRDDARVLVAEKHWEGCNGLQLTEEMKVTVAALASLLLLNLEHDYYHRVLSILIYPKGYRTEREELDEDGVMRPAGHNLGEAWYRGPVILSWRDVLAGGRHGKFGQNLALHEFAHQLDMEDRGIDGTPPLGSRQQYDRWQTVMQREYDRLCDDADNDRATLLDDYGATDRAEFFAVATECFFEQPRELQARHADLYAVLRDYYRQDPAQRVSMALD